MTEWPPFRGQVGHPEGVTLDACFRQKMTITGTCKRCGDRTLEPHPKRHRALWSRRLKLMFDDGKLVCASCRAPFWGLRVDECRTGLGPGRTLALWSRLDA